MEKIFIDILNMSLTASYVIVFVLVARYFLKRVSKIFSYALWAVVGIRLFVPFSFESVWSFIPKGVNPISQTIGIDSTPEMKIAIPLVSEIVSPILPSAAPTASINPMQIWLLIAEGIWIFGLLLLLFYSGFSIFRLKRQLRFACHEGMNVYLAEGLRTPFVLGIFRPKIYLPFGLSGDEKNYILLHEETHLARYDHVIKVAAFLLVCVHWFNPLVWIAFICMSRDMEMSCDEAVIRKLGDQVKQNYSASLLSLAAGRGILNGSPLAFGEGEVKGRIQNVLKYKKPTLLVGIIGILLLLVLGLGLLTNPLQTRGIPLLQTDGTVGEDTFFGYVASARVISGGTELVFRMDELGKITHLQTFIEDLRVEKQAVLESRSETRDSTHQIWLYRGGENVYLLFNFNTDFSQVWVDDGVKPSFTYQVVNPEKARGFFAALYKEQVVSNEWAEKLLSAKTEYVGDASKVGKILSLLKFPSDVKLKDGFELQTKEEPYGVILPFTVNEISMEKYRTVENQNILQEQAYIMLALIDNVGVIEIRLFDGNEEVVIPVTRAEANRAKGEDVRNFTKSPEKFRILLRRSIVEASEVTE